MVLWLGAGSERCRAQTNVLTYHNDIGRTGQNLTESVLTPANVNYFTFGKLLTVPVDGQVYAQPLYVSAVPIGTQGSRPVVYAATENDSLYAFDAQTGSAYWQARLLNAGETPADIPNNCQDLVPQMGITATPAIDLTIGPHGTIYAIAKSKDPAGNYHFRLHALDITTGSEEFGGPTEIAATYPGTGDNSTNGTVVFDPKQYNSRPGLLVFKSAVYVGFGSNCDHRPYTGWLMGYNELTLRQNRVFNFAPNGSEAGVWQGGGGIAAGSGGSIFVSVGNGTFDTTLNAQGFPSQGDYGNAFVKLNPVGSQLVAADYWTMYNTISESDADLDLGSGGIMLLPLLTDAKGKTHQLGIGAGKDRSIYVFNRVNMGKFNPSSNGRLYQEVVSALGGGEFGSPAWFNGTVYFGATRDVMRAFQMNLALLSSSASSTTAATFPYPGTTPAISANGTTNGIVWAVNSSASAVLHAYDATNLATELYNSNQAPSGRDTFGAGTKFSVPTIADGQVFVGTANSVVVFGLLPVPQKSSGNSRELIPATAR